MGSAHKKQRGSTHAEAQVEKERAPRKGEADRLQPAAGASTPKIGQKAAGFRYRNSPATRPISHRADRGLIDQIDQSPGMRVWKRVDFHMASEIFLCKNEMSLCKKGRAPGGRSKCRTPTATRARKRSRRSASRSPVQSGPRASLRLSPSLFLAPCPLLPARQPPSCRRPSRTVLLLAPVSAAERGAAWYSLSPWDRQEQAHVRARAPGDNACVPRPRS